MRKEHPDEHIGAGVAFIFLGVWWTWNIVCKYFVCRASPKDNPPYINEVSPRALIRKPLVSIVLIFTIIILDAQQIWRAPYFPNYMTSLHLAIFSIFLLYAFAGNMLMCS